MDLAEKNFKLAKLVGKLDAILEIRRRFDTVFLVSGSECLDKKTIYLLFEGFGESVNEEKKQLDKWKINQQ